MAMSQHVASSFLQEKSSESPAFISVGLTVVLATATSMLGCLSAGSKLSSSLVISMSGSGVGAFVGSRRVEMEIGRGSNAAGNSHYDGMFKFLQALFIPLSVLSSNGLLVPWQ